MISGQQNNKYWRRWGAVVRANHWRWIKGRLVPEGVRDAGDHHLAVWRRAKTFADQSCRAVIADDLRHGCHVHACGRDISHDHLDNDQFDRLLLLWGNERKIRGLLIEPLDILAQAHWDDPLLAKKESLIDHIAAFATEQHIRAITSDIWGTTDWRMLDYESLRGLNRKLRGNEVKRQRNNNPF
jgi:hypothetical protein